MVGRLRLALAPTLSTSGYSASAILVVKKDFLCPEYAAIAQCTTRTFNCRVLVWGCSG